MNKSAQVLSARLPHQAETIASRRPGLRPRAISPTADDTFERGSAAQTSPIALGPAFYPTPPTAPTSAFDQESGDACITRMAQTVFLAMQKRHLPPAHLSCALLKEALPVAQWQAQALYYQLTHSHRPHAAWRREIGADICVRDAISFDMRPFTHRVQTLLHITCDNQYARTQLYDAMCALRRLLNKAYVRGPSEPPQRTDHATLRAQLLAMSKRTYAYPFAG